MRLVKGRVSDGSILKLIKGWLRAPIVEENPETGRKQMVSRMREIRPSGSMRG